jgi:hypothetical protein
MSRFLLLTLMTSSALAGGGLGLAQDQAEATLGAGAQGAVGQGQPASSAALSPERFAAVFALIKPHADESAWARIPWLTNLHEARQKAVKEDRPLLVWRAGGGDVLGRA